MRDDPGEDDAMTEGGRGGTVAETLQLFSHDIRSAMSDVIGGLRLIDRERLTGEARMQVDRVQAAGEALAGLVDAALAAAAGETLITQDEAVLVLEDWLTALSGRWSGRARERDSAFEVSRDGEVPGLILVPQVPLDRIVGNLVSNALNHAPGAPVELRLSGRRGVGLRIAVADGGPGYPEAVLDRVRAGSDAGPVGNSAGSGLGLRIAAELSRQLGGTLDLRNTGQGGEAVLHLPERLLDWDGAGHAPCIPPDLSGLRILVAEDNLTNQTILRQLLGKMKAEPVFVVDGIAALEMLDRQPFDIALIDIEMPRLSGLEVMAAVRARTDAVAGIPLVALTAYVLRDNREAIYAAGADGIIGKPISSGGEFGRAILRYAGRPAGLPEPEDVLAGGATDEGFGVRLHEAVFGALMEVAGEDGRAELLERLLEDLAGVLSALDAGVAAGDVPEIRAQTHILIAISGAVGAERLNRLSEVLNIAAKRRRLDDLAALYAPCRIELQELIAHVAREAGGQGAA